MHKPAGSTENAIHSPGSECSTRIVMTGALALFQTVTALAARHPTLPEPKHESRAPSPLANHTQPEMQNRITPLTNTSPRSMPSARIGSAGLYVYAFGAITSNALASIGLFLMSVGAILQWRHFWDSVRTQRTFWLASLFVLYVATAATAATFAYPLTSDAQLGAALDLLAASGPGIVLAGYWLGTASNRPRLAQRLLVATLFGLLSYISYKQAWPPLFENRGERFSMDMSPNAAGLISATMLWVALVSLLCRGETSGTGLPAWGIRLSMFALLILGTVMLAASGSKSALIAAILVVPVAGALLLRSAGTPKARLPSMAIVAAAILAGTYVSMSGMTVLKDRVSGAWLAVERIFVSDEPVGNDGSIAPRLWIWSEAQRKFSEHPIFGWGPGSAKMTLADATNPEIRKFPHYHNLPANLLVTLGILGTTIFYGLHASILIAAWKSVKEGRLEIELFSIATGALALFHVAHLFQYRLNNVPGQFLLTFASALATCGAFSRTNARKRPSTLPLDKGMK